MDVSFIDEDEGSLTALSFLQQLAKPLDVGGSLGGQGAFEELSSLLVAKAQAMKLLSEGLFTASDAEVVSNPDEQSFERSRWGLVEVFSFQVGLKLVLVSSVKRGERPPVCR